MPVCESINIGPYTFEEYLQVVATFHGYPAPGVIIGGFMVELAQSRIPAGTLYDAMCETGSCLPDAIQLLTPCSIGNGWLRVFDCGRYALTLYDKYQGGGWRVFLDPARMETWPEIKRWFFKLTPKKEQDEELLRTQIKEAGTQICGVQPVQIQPHLIKRHSKGRIEICPSCHEAYPAKDGRLCQACQGKSPYMAAKDTTVSETLSGPTLKSIPVEQALGQRALHDMTMIIPGVSKGPGLSRGQTITAGDLCRLHQMGRRHVYVQGEEIADSGWMHEDEVAQNFAQAMAGEGVTFTGPPREGKINLLADRDGLLMVDATRLARFNSIPGVMCACRRGYTVVTQGQVIAGTRAIPLFLPLSDFHHAMDVLDDEPLFKVVPMRQARVGILVTGTEVFRGLVQDKFAPIITAKVEKMGCRVVDTLIVPDEQHAITHGVKTLLEAGIDLLVTTAGLSVDPDDVTRQGLQEAGATEMLYGAPILPGAMTLLAHIGPVQVIGVPACALYFNHTSFDLLLPRLLAEVPISRQDLAQMGHGALCQECPTCNFPICPFGS